MSMLPNTGCGNRFPPPWSLHCHEVGGGGNSIVAPCMSIFVETFLPLYFPSNFPPKRSLGIDGLQKIKFHYFTLSSDLGIHSVKLKSFFYIKGFEGFTY